MSPKWAATPLGRTLNTKSLGAQESPPDVLVAVERPESWDCCLSFLQRLTVSQLPTLPASQRLLESWNAVTGLQALSISGISSFLNPGRLSEAFPSVLNCVNPVGKSAPAV